MEKRIELQRHAKRLTGPTEDAHALARRLGLEGSPVTYWLVDYNQMNELIAYDGFPTRYPHWRWGMKFERQQKQDQYGAGKAFEIVINDEPPHAFLQESNSLADQKGVITHVEAHADFFANNRWYGLFGDEVEAAAMLENHARRIESYMADPEIGRERVERWIDSVLPLVDTIDQHRAFERLSSAADDEDDDDHDRSPVAELDISADVEGAVFDDEWLEAYEASGTDDEPIHDVLAFLRAHGMQFDEERQKAVEMDEWQQDIIDMLRTEAYYFAPQKMTKVMNEGWAIFWESLMMGDEAFAGDDEFIDYAEHLANVLGSPGLNPYQLGRQLWEHIENTANRREVAERLLRVEGISWRNFHDAVDFDHVHELLTPEPPLDAITTETVADLEDLAPDKVDQAALDRALSGDLDVDAQPWRVLTYRGLAERHFSLTHPENRGFLRAIDRDELERISRYLFDTERYASIEQAIADVEYTAGWDRLYAVRESHNDVTFIDEFLTPSFIQQNEYFTYEFSFATGEFRVASTDPEDVKKKLLLQFTNFGKPTITVEDGNYNNRNELLLAHQYNGIALDLEQAGETLKRVFDLWGRPVNVKTIIKELDERDREVAKRRGREPDPEESGKLLRYDGEDLELRDLPWEAVEDIAASDVDYSTQPEDWLQ